MHVRADDAALNTSLLVVGPVVAVALQDFAEGLRVRAEERAAAVVLETDQRARCQAFDRAQDDDVADKALLPRLGPHVDQPDAVVSLTVRRLVVLTEQLVTTAHGEDLRAVRDRFLQ